MGSRQRWVRHLSYSFLLEAICGLQLTLERRRLGRPSALFTPALRQGPRPSVADSHVSRHRRLLRQDDIQPAFLNGSIESQCRVCADDWKSALYTFTCGSDAILCYGMRGVICIVYSIIVSRLPRGTRLAF